MLVFVYGTLMRGFHNHRLLLTSQYIGRATTVGRFKMKDVGFPYIRRNWGGEGSPVRGEVFDIGDPLTDPESLAILRRLDALEGVPHHHYIRRRALVRIDGREDAAFAHLYEATSNTWMGLRGRPELVEDGNWGRKHADVRSKVVVMHVGPERRPVAIPIGED